MTELTRAPDDRRLYVLEVVVHPLASDAGSAAGSSAAAVASSG